MKTKIALAQIDSVLGDVRQNVRRHVDCVRRAKEQGATVVVFPELSLTGYSLKDLTWDVAIKLESVPVLQPLIEASDRMSIFAGGVEETAEFALCNSAFLVENGKLRTVHRKTYLPTYGMFEESRYFTPGTSVRAFDTAFGRAGLLICEDMWHLPLPYLLAKEGANVIIAIAASPTRLSGQQDLLPIARTNAELHRAYARLLSSVVVFCNRVGFEDGVNFWGGSEIVDPSGVSIVQGKLFDEDLVVAEIDTAEVKRSRQFSRHFLDDDLHLVLRELKRISRKQSE